MCVSNKFTTVMNKNKNAFGNLVVVVVVVIAIFIVFSAL
jgi:hypothetical protein